MNVLDPRKIRNVGLFGHQGTGKTSFAEALLFSAKVFPKLGSIADGTSQLDTEPEEIKRKGSIGLHLGALEWNGHKINVLDTPGDPNFAMDMRATISAVDLAAMFVSATDGVQVQTDRIWSIAEEKHLPRAVIVNKLDRERADFESTLADIRESLSAKVTPVQLPFGKEAGFSGVIDLVAMKLRRVKDESGAYVEEEIPADLEAEAVAAHELLVDAVAATDDALTEKYLEEGDLGTDDLQRGLRKAIAASEIFPLLCASGLKNIGATNLLDFLVESSPMPMERPAKKATDPRNGQRVDRACDPAGPLATQVFKTIVDQFVGKLSIMRVWSGTLPGDGQLLNTSKGSNERYTQLITLQGKKSLVVPQAVSGDIVVIAKLKDTATGDTLSETKSPTLLSDLPIVKPVITYALKPKTKQDEDRIANALSRLSDEDPTLEIGRDVEAGETLLSGVGQTHIEITVERLRRKYSVDVELLPPKIPYRETIKGVAKNVEGKHKKQSGGRGQFGVAIINLEPNRGLGYEFVDKIVGGAIPRNFIPSVDKGIRGAMVKGVYAGFPVVDVKVELIDGKFHDVDSSDFSFQMAGSKGFKQAFMAAKPILLEPVMNLEVTIPEESTGDVIGDINQRRGRVLGVDAKGKNQVIKAQAPMSELLTYAPDLRSITSGRSSFTMEYSHYDEVPANLAEKIVAGRVKAKDEDDE
ncbi:MAG: elongation factor G [Myxococcales bacterium]|jgi:elongation factor G|nr:elongation factor G [Myxococcales bacterium]